MAKLFYCEKCKLYDENFDDKNVKHTFTNPRDGLCDRVIIHVKCPNCGNVLSGFIRLHEKDECSKEGKQYYKEVIKMYQLDMEEGGYLDGKNKLINDIKNPKPIKKCVHDYEYITTDKYNFNEYKCKKCGQQILKNALYDSY